MQTLVQALKSEYSKWPEGITKFICDPDGEVRGYPIVSYDFYPEVDVYKDEKASDIGLFDGVVVTKEIFEAA